MKQKFSIREKLPFFILAIMLLLFLLLSFNRVASLNTLRESLQLQEQALMKEQERLLLLRQLEKEGPHFTERLELFENLIPEETTRYQLMQHLQKIATLNGIRLLQVSFNDEKPTDAYVEIPLELSLEGSFQALLKLLRTMREGERAFRVDNIEIYTMQENTMLSIVIKVSMFFSR